MNTGARIFMLLGATGLVVLLGLPLLLAPMRWGRWLKWQVPAETALANYLGRSLGGVGLAIAIVGYKAAYDPWAYRAMFDLVIWMGVFLTGVHIYGFLKRNQPRFENVEIFLYPLISLLAFVLYPIRPS